MTEPAAEVISVAELDRRLKRAVERSCGEEWVEGEIGSIRRAASGHVYFSLRDEHEDASIDCVMYRLEAQRSRLKLVDGARVQLQGHATLWAPRGRLQFVAVRCRPAGRGALLLALEQLKHKLQAEGLFAESRKRPLPAEVQVVGVVTSAHGAAFQDICAVAFRRGGARIVLSPALVQGEGAAESLVHAIDLIERLPDLDVLIIGRGGGSGEDLMAFNDERVVRRIAQCRVPVVSAVGHDIDVTLADLVADVRAATPSQAAELAILDLDARKRLLLALSRQLVGAVRARIHERDATLARLGRRLSDPRFVIVERQLVLDDLRWRAERQLRRIVTSRRTGLEELSAALYHQHPERVLARNRTRLAPLSARLVSWAERRIATEKGRLADHTARLDTLSPLGVLARGYSLVSAEDGGLVHRAADLRVGQSVDVRLAEGRLRARVTEVQAGARPDDGRSLG